MAKNTEKIKTNLIREQITKQYNGKIKQQAAAIARLQKENASLLEQNRQLSGQVTELESRLMSMSEWLERMQDYCNLSDEQMETLRRELNNTAERQKAMSAFTGLCRVFDGMMPFTYGK